MGDFWFLRRGKTTHMFYLIDGIVGIGHAVSRDLFHWEERGTILLPGPEGSWDDAALWTGSAVEKEGKCYLFYTGLCKSEKNGSIQRTGLAISEDFITWNKHPGNPVLEADTRWYEARDGDVHNDWVSWRDPFVFYDDTTGFYYALLCARANKGPGDGRGCIGLARSLNLLEWEVHPPLVSPGFYRDMEVPQVFKYNGKYYIIHSTTRNWYSNLARKNRRDCEIQNGTHYLFSNRLFSGYRIPRDDTVACMSGPAPYAAQVIKTDSSLLLFHWGPDRRALALPKELAVMRDGSLKATYCNGLETLKGEPITDGLYFIKKCGEWANNASSARVDSLKGESFVILDAAGSDFVLDCELEVEAGESCGLLIRYTEDKPACLILLDAECGKLSAVNYREDAVYIRNPTIAEKAIQINTGKQIHIKIVSDGTVIEAYLDNELLLSFVFNGPSEGNIGLWARNSWAKFCDLKGHSLKA